ncbi:glycosyltransferase [Flavobacterium piscis]|uniref:Glycosyltransferase involved in cell wall biosynthesis n=1 Tax=Flavobacterium piscis TaxID=1114874 RepID=A0ABU1YAJ8_9FLAO|nr:glycosyltransferase [Flavobacterium piscis]MDR7210670.1 glycosyltransferase involved in cell wall biosynthesis [Flavobacterium piscis]
MKILHVITSMNPKLGGVCQVLRNLNPHLVEKGINVEIVCLDEKDDDFGIKDDFVIHKTGPGKTSYKYQPKLTKWLINNVLNFDCVVVHGLWQYHNFAVNKSIRLLKKQNIKVPKVVIMPHGMLDPYFQKSMERRWKAHRNEMVWFFIEKQCINDADVVFYTCEEEMRLAATTFKEYKPQKVANVGLGIQSPPRNIDDFKQAFYNQCTEIRDKKYFLFLSRIDEKKGIDLLINAYNELCHENPDLPDLVIAGPLESLFAQKMVALASHNQFIHFSGMLSGEAKWGAFYNCEAYLLPSHQENFGIAIVEAMACKKPVLITENVNIWREIHEGGGGWIVSLKEKDGLKKALLEIINHPQEKLVAKGLKAFKTYQNNFDIEICANKFIQELKNIYGNTKIYRHDTQIR